MENQGSDCRNRKGGVAPAHFPFSPGTSNLRSEGSFASDGAASFRNHRLIVEPRGRRYKEEAPWIYDLRFTIYDLEPRRMRRRVRTSTLGTCRGSPHESRMAVVTRSDHAPPFSSPRARATIRAMRPVAEGRLWHPLTNGCGLR